MGEQIWPGTCVAYVVMVGTTVLVIFIGLLIMLIFAYRWNQKFEYSLLNEVKPKPPARLPRVSRKMSTEQLLEAIGSDPRLSCLVDRCRLRPVYPVATGPYTQKFASQKDDPRHPPGEDRCIILMGAESNVEGLVVYGRSFPGRPALKGSALEAKIAENRENFFKKGPPYVADPADLDMIAVDSYPRYLYNIYVINQTEFEEMEKFMLPVYPKWFENVEYGLMSCPEAYIVGLREYLVKWQKLHMEKQKLRLLLPRECLYKYIHLSKNPVMISLFWFYELYRPFVDDIKLEPCHMQRLPLQALILCMFREDLSKDITYQLMYWYRLTSFGVMRAVEIDRINRLGAVMYPLNCMLKMRAEHEYPLMTEKEVRRFAVMLGGEKVKTENDWEVEM